MRDRRRLAASSSTDQSWMIHAIGMLGAVKLKDLTARQVRKALAELSASLSTRSLRPDSAQHHAYEIASPR